MRWKAQNASIEPRIPAKMENPGEDDGSTIPVAEGLSFDSGGIYDLKTGSLAATGSTGRLPFSPLALCFRPSSARRRLPDEYANYLCATTKETERNRGEYALELLTLGTRTAA